MNPFISIVIPVYKNQDTLIELHTQLKLLLSEYTHEILFIDDASPDASDSVIKQLIKKDPLVKSHRFEKNVGQHRAVLKGFDMSRGTIVVSMDADLQDPPAMIPQLIKVVEEGYDAVFAGKHGKYESFIKLFTSRIFKYLLHLICKIPKDGGMFFAMNRKMAEKIKDIPMEPPFVVAMIGLANLKICSIPFVRSRRESGKSAYTAFMRLSIGMKALSQAFLIRRKLQNATDQQKYYKRANHHNIFPENYPKHIRRTLEKVFNYIPIASEHKVLEVGCGMGRFTIPLAQQNMPIEGLDVSPSLLKELHDSMPSIPVHCADLLNPPDDLKGQYDVILGFFILHHLPDQKKTFESLSKLLRPGGKILFIEPNPYNPLYYLQIFMHPKMRWKNERSILKMRRSPISSAMKDFSHFRMERFGFFPPFLYEKLSKIEGKLEKIPLLAPLLPYQIFYAEKMIHINQ